MFAPEVDGLEADGAVPHPLEEGLLGGALGGCCALEPLAGILAEGCPRALAGEELAGTEDWPRGPEEVAGRGHLFLGSVFFFFFYGGDARDAGRFEVESLPIGRNKVV